MVGTAGNTRLDVLAVLVAQCCSDREDITPARAGVEQTTQETRARIGARGSLGFYTFVFLVLIYRQIRIMGGYA